MIWVLFDCNLVNDPIWKENREIELAKTKSKCLFLIIRINLLNNSSNNL